MEMSQEKIKLIKDQKERETKELNKKLADLTAKFKNEREKSK